MSDDAIEEVFEFKKWQSDLLRKSLVEQLDETTRQQVLIDTMRSDVAVKPLFSFTAFFFYGFFFLWLGIIGSILDIEWMKIGYLGITAVFILYHFIFERKHWRRKLSIALALNGVRPKGCLICKYNLFGTTSKSCPECGEPLADVSTQS